MKKLLILFALFLFPFQVMATNHTLLEKGKNIFRSSCGTCHATGLAQAPKAHDISAWNERFKLALARAKKYVPNASIKAQKEKAMDLLVLNVKEGIGVMPAGGMCPQCQLNDYKAAIAYMMNKSDSFKPRNSK